MLPLAAEESRAQQEMIETRKGSTIHPVDSYKSHVTSPIAAFGHGLTVYWETARVARTNSTIQHAKYALFSPRAVCENEPLAGVHYYAEGSYW